MRQHGAIRRQELFRCRSLWMPDEASSVLDHKTRRPHHCIAPFSRFEEFLRLDAHEPSRFELSYRGRDDNQTPGVTVGTSKLVGKRFDQVDSFFNR